MIANDRFTANDKFIVQLPTAAQDTTGFYKREFLGAVQKKYPWLTIAGLDAPFTTPKGNVINGVQYAGAGNLITVGTARQHDVNWVKRAAFACEKGYNPVYDLVKDWNTVMGKLETYAMNRKPAPRYYGNTYVVNRNTAVVRDVRVTVTNDFIYINNEAYPRTLTAAYYASLPVSTRRAIEGYLVTFSKI